MTSKFIKNQNENVIKDFGQEWEEYNQRDLDRQELLDLYWKIFFNTPLKRLAKNQLDLIWDVGVGDGARL